MDPAIRRQRTLDAIKRIIVRESLKQPTVVIFEDLHWIDSETQALLDLLADSIAGARLLLLVNYRPEYRHEWSGRTHYLQLRLDPLGSENAADMLEALLGNGADLDSLKSLIAERTGGNPFFMEEMVQALFEQGILARNGKVKLLRPLSQSRLPVTVQGVLAARIDRLPAKDKELLQMLAVVGNEFPLTLARQVSRQPEEDLQRSLANLRLGDFKYEQPALADVDYAFKHVLTHEVAYDSVLIERRKQLHERAGQALESMFVEHLEEHLVELAHHYSHSDNVGKAVEYLGRAGVQAMGRSALADAIASLVSAIDLLQKQPASPENMRRESRLQLALGAALVPVRGETAAEVERAFTRAAELCEGLDDHVTLCRSLYGLWAGYNTRGELPKAYQLAQQLWQRVQNTRDSLVMLARFALGETRFYMGELLRARAQFEEVIHLYDFERHSKREIGDPGVFALSLVAPTLWMLGYPDQALKRGDEAMALAQAQPANLIFALNYVCTFRVGLRETHGAQDAVERIMAISAEHGLTQALPYGTACRGWALVQEGNIEEGISRIQQSLAMARAASMELLRPILLRLLAEADIAGGRVDEALDALTEALTLAEKQGGRLHDAELHRLKGDLLLSQDESNFAAAQNCFERATDVARHQSAKSYELRATTSLARLFATQGRRDEARAMLAEIYGWFTEGFDTADLKEAKALLEQLSR
jgi:predicted ATPase